MTTVNSTTSTAATADSSASTAVSKVSSLGINDFITLMTTQLKYQDPTQPQDATAYVSQLAQFSTVSGVQEMNSSINQLLQQYKSSQTLSATSLVGHKVLVPASSTDVSSGDQVDGAVDTPSGASNIQVVVEDSAGQVVRQLSVAASSGLSKFTWDGLDDSGKAVGSGTYKFNAIASVNGKSVSADTLLASTVDSVTIDTTNNSLQLNTGSLGAVQLADVRQVY